MELKDKAALITGASRGIGRGIAKVLAAHGMRLALNYRLDRWRSLASMPAIGDRVRTARALSARWAFSAVRHRRRRRGPSRIAPTPISAPSLSCRSQRSRR